MHAPALPRTRGERPALGRVAGLALLARTWWKAGDFDRQLGEGADPSRCAELSLRAAQLTTTRRRQDFAGELESVLAAAPSGRCHLNDCVPLRRAAILDAEDDILALAAALRSSAQCRPHAAGIVSFLLRDAASPLYYEDAPATPAQLARAAIAGFTSS
jgi:hypothetical protein